jgi:hypothetical protein
VFPILLQESLKRFDRGIRIPMIVTPGIDEMNEIARQGIGPAPIGHVTFLQRTQ